MRFGKSPILGAPFSSVMTGFPADLLEIPKGAWFGLGLGELCGPRGIRPYLAPCHSFTHICVYIYIYICIYICVCVDAHMFMSIFVYMYAYVCLRMDIYICTRIRVFTCIKYTFRRILVYTMYRQNMPMC